MKVETKDCPILEQFDDDSESLEMFFSNGKKEFWRFEKVQGMGIDKCVIFFPRDFTKIENIYAKCELIYEFKAASSISPVYLYDNKILIALSPLGGPAAANLMEELVYVGIKHFIGVGSCGAIANVDIDLDQYFVPTHALRDEGVSYHYLTPSRYVVTSPTLNEAICKTLDKHKEAHFEGLVWTTDAIYRETPQRISARVAEGCLGAEMETASLAAIAKAKRLDYSCILYYSDYNSGTEWQTRIYDKFQLREELVTYAIEALLSI